MTQACIKKLLFFSVFVKSSVIEKSVHLGLRGRSSDSWQLDSLTTLCPTRIAEQCLREAALCGSCWSAAKAPSTPATTSKHIVECYKSNDSFDKVETRWTCSVCFDFVERTVLYDKLIRHCCRFWQQQSRMLLRQSRTLLRYCCWCGRRLSNVTVSLSHQSGRVLQQQQAEIDLPDRNLNPRCWSSSSLEYSWRVFQSF